MAAAGSLVAIFALPGPGWRFAMGWVVIVGLVYFVLYRLARRVAFEVIRKRG